MKKLIILVVFILFINSFVFCYTIDAKIDTMKTDLKHLEVGDRIFFDVSVQHDKESGVHYIPQEQSEIFIILSYTTDIQNLDNEIQTGFHFASAFFDTGLQTIPPQEFILTSSEDSVKIYSDSLQVTINSILPADSVALKDIKPPVSLTLGFWDIALPILIIGIIILAIILITRSRKGLPIIPEKKKKKLSAHVIALKKIEQLKLQDYITKGDIKRYYVEISWICREYLENRYHKLFLEMTGFEIRQSLKNLNVEKRMEINSILQECDRVKFAKYIPPIHDAEKILDDLVNVIYATKEQEIEEVQDEN
ncbi:MAG: hypothetical protein J7M10_00615 [Candidatus Cloacimonetes bacterium]|nr:hypothetical protein [Candidatus Cloacimonadota bacterium]